VSGLTTKGQATRDRIVAAAAELIYRQGVARTTTLEVEEAAGVSSSQIFHYFGDKQGLVRAVITLQTDRILAAQQAMLAGNGMAALEAWRNSVVAMQTTLRFSGGCPIGSLTSELAEVDLDARADLAGGFGRWEATIHQVLRDMERRGELRADADADQLALALLTALQGGLLLGQARRDTAALEAGLDAVLERIRQLTNDPPDPVGVSGPG
jgi:TetR/AcrR family transcriptional repressor of nem operon